MQIFYENVATQKRFVIEIQKQCGNYWNEKRRSEKGERMIMIPTRTTNITASNPSIMIESRRKRTYI